MKGEKKLVRVLHVVGGMNLGGTENFLMNIYRNIDRTKVQFDFLVNRKGVFDDDIKKLGGNIYYIPALQKVGSIIYVHNLKKFLKSKDYTIIHSHLSQVSGLILQVAKKCGIKNRIAHCHNSSNSANNFIARTYKNYLNTKINKNATHFFACSELAAKWLFKEKANEAIIIKNAIDIDRFRFNEEKRRKIRAELNINEDDIVIGHVGRLNKQKNHNFLINLFNEYQKENRNSKLLLVGDGDLRNEIEEQISKLKLNDKVILAGNHKNIENYYNVMDVFVFPSLFEGLGMALIEAQINGLRCLTTKGTVPYEVNVTGQVRFIDLKNMDEWLLRLKNIKTERYEKLDNIKKAGYDIKEESKKLVEKYMECVGL